MYHFHKKSDIVVSWSILNAYETKSKKDFIKTFFEGTEQYETREMIFGTCMGKIIELNRYDVTTIYEHIAHKKELSGGLAHTYYKTIENILYNPLFVDILTGWRFELYSQFEVQLKAKIDGVPCVCHIDNAQKALRNFERTKSLEKFREFKTGKIPWTQERVENHGQLAFYALMIGEKRGVFPEEVYLDWIETTQDEYKNIHPTGKIHTFAVEITPEKIADIQERIHKAYTGICKLWDEWQASKDPETQKKASLNIFEQYREIEKKKRILEDQQAELKPSIEEALQEQEKEKYEFLDEAGGTFFFTTRKKYVLPQYIKQKEKEYKDLKKEYEEAHEPDGFTQSLTFKM